MRQLIHGRFSPSLRKSLSRNPPQNIQADLPLPAQFFRSICCFCSFPSPYKPPQSSHQKADSRTLSILALHGILLSFQAEVHSEMPVKDIICIEKVSFVKSHILECLFHSGLHRTFQHPNQALETYPLRKLVGLIVFPHFPQHLLNTALIWDLSMKVNSHEIGHSVQ